MRNCVHMHLHKICIKLAIHIAELIGTNVVHDPFSFAEMHSLQYFRMLSQGMASAGVLFRSSIVKMNLKYVTKSVANVVERGCED